MLEQALLLELSSSGVADNITSHIRQEYRAYKHLFQAQPADVQQLLQAQAATLAEAAVQGLPQVRFTLPDGILYPTLAGGWLQAHGVPVEKRKQSVGRLWSRVSHASLLPMLCKRLSELEGSVDPAVSTSAGLLRYAIAMHMVYHMLPAGKVVVYSTPEGDDIPSQPASHFYLPEWVAFDLHGQLLPGSVREAESMIASMQQSLDILQLSIVIAPYMLADEMWQQKRYGMLGQLVNQGRALAHYHSQAIIQTIKRRIAEHKLDRGLRLDLPYFDDQKLRIESLNFTVIPAGWIMFVPAFAVLAAREQQIKVAENTRLSIGTRKHLLAELQDLELAFVSRD